MSRPRPFYGHLPGAHPLRLMGCQGVGPDRIAGTVREAWFESEGEAIRADWNCAEGRSVEGTPLPQFQALIVSPGSSV